MQQQRWPCPVRLWHVLLSTCAWSLQMTSSQEFRWATSLLHLSNRCTVHITTWLQVGSSCGQQGQACCLVPAAGADPWSNIRASCNSGLTCIVKNINSLPYGSSRHAQTILGAALNSSLAAVLRSTHIMGACVQLPSALSVEGKAVLPQQQAGPQGELPADADTLFMPCGYTNPCETGSWCAGGLSGLGDIALCSQRLLLASTHPVAVAVC
jgi:hypothetical protein